jgi:alpha-beta hydrolase superfamily lysophospholipase
VAQPVYWSYRRQRIVPADEPGYDAYDSIWQPRVPVAGKAPVIYMHGANPSVGIAYEANRSTQMGVREVLMAVAGEGHTVVCMSAPDTWGNATLVKRARAGIQYVRDNFKALGPAVLIGASHGGLCALRYYMENGHDVAGIIGMIGVVDMDDVRDNDLGGMGLRADIDAAWGVTYPAALPAGANPADNPSRFTGVPIQWHYASDDAIARATPITTFASAVGGNMTTYNLGALGHTDAAILAVNETTVLNFIETVT